MGEWDTEFFMMWGKLLTCLKTVMTIITFWISNLSGSFPNHAKTHQSLIDNPMSIYTNKNVLFILEIKKKMLKLGKERGCELVSRWYKACINHFYWAVISTPVLMGEVKLAKFQTFLHHIINKHKDLPNKLFNKCKHGVITVPKAWMLKGMLDITQKRLGIQNGKESLHGITQCSFLIGQYKFFLPPRIYCPIRK